MSMSHAYENATKQQGLIGAGSIPGQPISLTQLTKAVEKNLEQTKELLSFTHELFANIGGSPAVAVAVPMQERDYKSNSRGDCFDAISHYSEEIYQRICQIQQALVLLKARLD